MARVYKDYKVYCCFALNRLVSEFDIDIYQPGLDEKLDEVIDGSRTLSKEEIKHEIRSNHFMTNKVIEKLEEDGLVEMEIEDGKYRIRITKEGIMHVRKYNQFFLNIYREQIKNHYRYGGMPHWARDAEK
jgi:predicted transcriptional regulator